jgi:hypothetical protein
VIHIEYYNVGTKETHEGEPDGPVLLDGMVVVTKEAIKGITDVRITISYREANEYHEEDK